MVLALCGAIPVAVLTFFNVKNAYYLIFMVPFLAANAGAFFEHLWRRGPGMRRFAVAALAATLLVSFSVTGRRIRSASAAYAGYRRLSARAGGMLPADGRMIAPAEWAFGIGFDRVVQDDNLGYYSHRCPLLILDGGLAPDEIENLRKNAPAVLRHRNEMLTVYYKPVDRILYQRVTCPAGTHMD
jgi:hypothetical protein